MAIVFDEQHGPIRVVLEAEGGALALFKASERNAAVRASLVSGGQFWVVSFLGKRFSQYSATVLGYRVSEKWRKAKERYLGAAIPFVGFTPINGGNPPSQHAGRNEAKMLNTVQRGTSVSATATASRQSITIAIPFGHPVQADTSAVFRTVPDFEVTAIAREVARTLASIIETGRASNAKGAPRTIVGATTSLAARALPTGHPRRVG